jgi:sugar/nucleoside kinase (ribokinase family)
MAALGSRLSVATMGAEGALLYDGKSFYKQKPKLIDAVDTLGAGDSFLTAFLLHYLQNEQDGLEVSLAKAAEFAASSCLVEGAFGHGKAY